MSAVLNIDQLWKQYRLGVFGHGSLMQDLQSYWARLCGREDPNTRIDFGIGKKRRGKQLIWALQDVSFSVGAGEVVGILGKNGSGKSTLLKIITRITGPTRGQVKIRGRVASLLEVGTGFHAELTGRENIFLNGTILGMKVSEVRKKFDEIVDFAGVEEFIDTPVKRYSSGMYVRLAFAVAAHLESEILLVDEVLAVGDAAFQTKCLGRLNKVASEGRTVLFVSHNLDSLQRLCSRGVLLNNGVPVTDGPIQESLEAYRQILQNNQVGIDTEAHNPDFRRSSGGIRFSSISTHHDNGEESYNFSTGQKIRVKLEYKAFAELDGLILFIALRSSMTKEFITSISQVLTHETLAAGTSGVIGVELPDNVIRPGEYPLLFEIRDLSGKHYDTVDGLTAPLIIGPPLSPHEALPDEVKPVGYFTMPFRATLEN